MRSDINETKKQYKNKNQKKVTKKSHIKKKLSNSCKPLTAQNLMNSEQNYVLQNHM